MSKEYYTIKEISEMAGVCKDTIRNYVRKGILDDRRHPVNNYRLFTKKDVEVVKSINEGVVVKQRK